MRKLIKIALLLIVLTVAIPVITLFALSKMHHRSVHNELVALLNNEFEGKIVFQGFSFSYLRYFPKTHIGLEEVAIKDGNRDLITIGSLDVTVNTISLWKRTVRLHDLIIRDAALHSVIDSLGKKPQTPFTRREKTGSMHRSKLIEADNILVLNSALFFGNEVKGNRTAVHIDEARLNIMAEDSLILIGGALEGRLDSLVSNHTTLFRDQPIKAVDVAFSVNTMNGDKKLTNGYLLAHSLKLTPRLSMKPVDDGQQISLQISGEEDFNAFLDLFEFHTGLQLQQVNPGARLVMSYNQEGFVNPFRRPYSELEFRVSDAEFAGEALPFPLKVREIKGNYNNGEAHSPQSVELVIDTLLAEVEESFVRSRFRMTNLKDPEIDARFIAGIDLDHLIRKDKDFRLSGIIEADLELDGKISELRKLHFEGKQKAAGTLKVKDLQLVLNDQRHTIELISGSTLLTNHILEVTSLVGAFNESAFHFQGIFGNLDRLILKNREEVSGSFALEFDRLDLRELNFSGKEKEDNVSSGFLPFTRGDFNLEVSGNRVITDIGALDDVKVFSRMQNRELTFDAFSFGFRGGSVNGSGRLLFDNDGPTEIHAKTHMDFHRLTLDSLVSYLAPGRDVNEQPAVKRNFPFTVSADVEFAADEIIYRDIQASATATELRITNDLIRLEGFHSLLPFGEVSANIVLSDYASGNTIYYGDIALNVDSLTIDEALEWDAFRIFSAEENAPAKAERGRKKIPWFSGDSEVNVIIDADYLAYRDVSVRDMELIFDLRHDSLILEKMDLRFAGGRVHAHGHISGGSGSIPGYLYSDADSIDIGEILLASDNFGQEFFTPENSSGRISWAFHHYFEMEENRSLIKDANLVILNTLIHNATFDRVAPIEKTLFFVGHKSKDHMIIEDLHLTAFLFGDKFYFADLLMNDNIANLDAFGTVDLSNKTMDIGLEISLSDLFFRSKEKRMAQTEQGVVNLDRDSKLFLKLEGPLTDHSMEITSKRKFNGHREDLTDAIRSVEDEYSRIHRVP